MDIFVAILIQLWVSTTVTLLHCGDIEANPGPSSSGNEYFMYTSYLYCF